MASVVPAKSVESDSDECRERVEQLWDCMPGQKKVRAECLWNGCLTVWGAGKKW